MGAAGIVSVGTAKMIGFLLAICGNTLIACSLTLQKSAHNSLSNAADASSDTDESSPQHHANASQQQQQQQQQQHSQQQQLQHRQRDATPDHAARSTDIDPEAQIQLPPAGNRRSSDDISSAPHKRAQSANSPPSAALSAGASADASPSSPTGPSPASNLAFLTNRTWWIGTFLMAAGEVGNFAAFAFAPASLVAPLGAWSVVLSAVLAHVFLHEHVSNTNLIGIALCVTGAFLIGTSGPDVSSAEAALDAEAVTHLLLRIPFVVFILATLTATAALMYVAHRTTLGERYIFVYVGVSSLLGGVTVVCAKALSTFLRRTFEGHSQFGNWLPFALGLTLAMAILLQLRYLNMAMAQFGNAQVIPVYYVLFTTCAMSSGVIMYREFDQLTLRNLPFFLGICSTMSGVFLVSRSAKHGMSRNGAGMRGMQRVRNADEEDFEPMLPVSPMSSPRGSQQAAWS